MVSKKIILLFVFILLSPCLVAALQINEIVYNPKGRDANAEWIELYNPDNEWIDFEEGWFIADDKYEQQIQDFSGYVDGTNATYIVITSCYSSFYDSFEDIDIIFNPVDWDYLDEEGLPRCDRIGNNLKNTEDYLEVWYCGEGYEEEEYCSDYTTESQCKADPWCYWNDEIECYGCNYFEEEEECIDYGCHWYSECDTYFELDQEECEDYQFIWDNSECSENCDYFISQTGCDNAPDCGWDYDTESCEEYHEEFDPVDCELIDFFLYNSSMGGDGNGKSLQLIDDEWVEAFPTPGRANKIEELSKKEITLKVNTDVFLFIDIDYANLFKIQIKNKDCTEKENIAVYYTVTDEYGELFEEDTFTVEIGCTKTSGTGDIYFEDIGHYTICGYVADEEDISDCLDVEVVDTSDINCDISIDINTTKDIYEYPEGIKFMPLLSDETYPFKIDYWFEDQDGDAMRNKVTTLNTNRKSYKPSISEMSTMVVLKAELSYIACNDINLDNNKATKSITYLCQPLDDDLKIEVGLDGDCGADEGVLNYPYKRLFKITNLGYTPCIPDSVNATISYNISYNGGLVKDDTFDLTNLKKSKATSTGSWTPAQAGNYTICGSIISSTTDDIDSTNNLACKDITIIDTSVIPCSIFLNITTDKEVYTEGESIKFYNKLNDKTFPFTIEYWIEDFFGNAYKDKCNTSNTNQKSWKTNIEEQDRVLFIKSAVYPLCNDSNITDNYAEKMVIVKSGSSEFIEDSEESSLEIVEFDEEAKFGELVKVKVKIYKGNTNRYSISLYAEDDGKKASETTKIHLYDKYSSYNGLLPVQLRPNCNLRLEDGKYDIVLEGFGKEAREEIKIEGIKSSLCKGSSSSSSTSSSSSQSSSKKFDYGLVSRPEEVETDDSFEIEVRLTNNDDEDIDIDIWSYVYRGSKCYSGDREVNKKSFVLESGDSRIITLKSKIKDAKPGDYKIKVKIRKDNQKTTKDITETMTIVKEEAKEDEEKSTSGILEDGQSILKQSYIRYNPVTIYESSSYKAKKTVPYLITAMLVLLVVMVIWRR